jgi:hypothetical protein
MVALRAFALCSSIRHCGRKYFQALMVALLWTAAARAQDITSNLRGHWLLTETSGTTAADSSSTPHNGTYTNGVSLASSTAVPVDGAISAKFDGANDYVAVGTESWFDITGAITVAAWIKVDVFDTSNQAIVTKGDGAWRLQRNGTANSVVFSCSGLSTVSIASTVALNDGKWHHVVGQYGSGFLIIYIDGVLNNYASTSGSISTNSYNVRIGANAQTSGKEFDGAIYDVRVYNRALSPTDVAYLALQGGPVGRWKLGESSGTTAADSSIFGANGTVFGGASWSTRCNATGVFNFNGSSQYISVSNAAQLQPWGALTIAGWIRGDAWGSGTDVDTILRKGEGNPNNYALAISDGRVELLLDGNDGSGYRGNTVLSTGEWYHVAATWDGATVRIYVDGALDNTPASRSGYIGADTRPLYIGGRSGADLFDGLLQEVRLYNRALTQAEIIRLAGTAGYWKFAEGTGTTAADSSGVANNATLSGGATWTTDCAGNNNALLTDGAGGIAQTASAFTPPDEGTVAFWMRASGTPAGTARIFGTGGDWEVRQISDGTVAFDLCGEGGTDFATTVPLDVAGQWYHVAVSFDSSNDSYSIYIDGQLHKSGTNTNPMVQQAAAALSFGTRTGSTEYWQGALRDFCVYSRKLCPTEIAELYGLVGHWKLDESSGTLAADSSGLGRDATLVGTANWTAGKINNCLQLDGATKAEASSLMGSPKNVTISGWAYLTAPDSSGAELVSLGDYFAIRLDSGATTRAFFYNGSTWPAVSANQTFTGTGWHHFAAVFNDDGNYCKLFIDGQEAASLSTTVTIPYTGLGTKTVIGRHGNGSTIFDFTGKIDDVRVYNRALCASDVQALFDQGGGVFGGVKIIKWVEIQ